MVLRTRAPACRKGGHVGPELDDFLRFCQVERRLGTRHSSSAPWQSPDHAYQPRQRPRERCVKQRLTFLNRTLLGVPIPPRTVEIGA